MSQLNSLLESSANNWKSVQSDAARLADKWEKTGLLEGMSSEVNKNNMSMILENQAKQLVVESSQTGGGADSTGTFQSQTAVNIGGQWAGVALQAAFSPGGTKSSSWSFLDKVLVEDTDVDRISSVSLKDTEGASVLEDIDGSSPSPLSLNL